MPAKLETSSQILSRIMGLWSSKHAVIALILKIVGQLHAYKRGNHAQHCEQHREFPIRR